MKYGKQLSIFRLIISFLISFIIFTGVGYVAYKWVPKCWKSLFSKGKNKGIHVSDTSSDSEFDTNVRSLNLKAKPKEHKKRSFNNAKLIGKEQYMAIVGKNLYKRSYPKKSPKKRRSSSTNFWEKLIDQINGKTSSSSSLRNTKVIGQNWTSKRKVRFTPEKSSCSSDTSSESLSLPSGPKINISKGLNKVRYKNPNSQKMEVWVALFHADVKSLVKKYGGKIAEEYFVNLGDFWKTIKEKEEQQKKKVAKLHETISIQKKRVGDLKTALKQSQKQHEQNRMEWGRSIVAGKQTKKKEIEEIGSKFRQQNDLKETHLEDMKSLLKKQNPGGKTKVSLDRAKIDVPKIINPLAQTPAVMENRLPTSGVGDHNSTI